jgi:hypothetical protein
MGIQKRVKVMMMYPKRLASFPSVLFCPLSLVVGVRRHTDLTLS